MSAPQWEPTDQVDLLTLVADTERVTGRDSVTAFLAACETDAADHGGSVSVSRVGALMADQGIEPHRYSSFWSAFTGAGKPMRRANETDGVPLWEIRHGSTSGNNGKPFVTRRWVG